MRRPEATAAIVTAGALDAPVIAGLQSAVLPAGECWREADVAGLIAESSGLVRVAAGRAYGEVMPIGFALARQTGDEAELLSLGVLVEARGQGLGRRLVDAVAEAAAARGAARLVLEVAVDNAAALRLYDRAGFTRIGRRAAYYRRADNAWCDAWVLARALRAVPGDGTCEANG